MKLTLYLNLKEYFWNNLNKLTNNFSNLIVNDLGDGNIKCLWEISPIDNLRIDFSKTCFLAVRIFDISNNRNKINSTCIMKEMQVSKSQSSLTFPIPINKGVYYFEFGYRKNNGQWRKLAQKELNMGYRIKKIIQSFDNDNWFNPKIRVGMNSSSLHDKAYQLSFKNSIGGSEKVSDEKHS